MRGRPRRADLKELLWYEYVWVFVFLGLRDGLPETRGEMPGGYGLAVFLKHSGSERESLHVFRSGEKPRKMSALKTMGQEWHKRVRLEQHEFDALATGQKSRTVQSQRSPGEPHLWKALKRAKSAAQVRRICRRSKDWLKWEWKGKGFYLRSPSACPKALHDHAAAFCRAKQDHRYPVSNRPSSDDKRIEYLARVMAGLSLVQPIAPSTAVDLLRKMKHEKNCPCWRCVVRRLDSNLERNITSER